MAEAEKATDYLQQAKAMAQEAAEFYEHGNETAFPAALLASTRALIDIAQSLRAIGVALEALEAHGVSQKPY